MWLVLVILVLAISGVSVSAWLQNPDSRRQGVGAVTQTITPVERKTTPSRTLAQTSTMTLRVLTPTQVPTNSAALITSSFTATLTKTLQPSPTFVTMTNTPGPGLETPFGSTNQYLVHMVTAGESMEALAKRYDTSIAVLRAINLSEKRPGLWAGFHVVIAPGEKDVTHVGPMKAIKLTSQEILDDFLKKNNLTIEDFQSLNGIINGNLLEAGRWVILPNR